MLRWSLRSFTSTKMHTQNKAPMAEMLSRYWMFPYQVNSAKSPEPDGEGGGASANGAISGGIGPNQGEFGPI